MIRRLAANGLLLLAGCSAVALGTNARGAAPREERAVVERVVDGDTLIARAPGRRFRVRLIGVDTPEVVKPNTPVQCFGPESSAFAKKALNGERIRLEYDVERTDRFGRALAYVYRVRDGLFFNLELVRRGYATILTIPPDVAHVAEFVAAQRRARAGRLGLWGACVRR